MLTIEQLNPERVGYKHTTNRDRFWNLVDKQNIYGCWEWLGTRKIRYGRFKLRGGIAVTAHRYSYYLATNYYPKDDEYVCHTCDNIYCVNPQHLFLGTQSDNMQDMIRKGRNKDNSGDKNPNVKLSKEAVFQIRFLYKLGIKQKELSDMFDIGTTQVSRIIRNESWKN